MSSRSGFDSYLPNTAANISTQKSTTMSPKLKPLLLPLLVEERRKRESMSDSDLSCSSYYTQNSSASDIPSPLTPTFSNRAHFRYSSSASSFESTFHSTVIESQSSPTFPVSKSGKRSLPDVQEEPRERDEDLSRGGDANELYDCLCDDQQCAHQTSSLTARQDLDYDMFDGFFGDGDHGLGPLSKKRRAVESPFSGLASRFGTRFPSFSRKWRLKKGASTASTISNSQLENAASRAASSRSSSVSNLGRYGVDGSHEPQMPPTPTQSVFDSREEISTAIPIDIEKANRSSEEYEERFATTPLLPPLMLDASANTKQVHLQSPLQSPSVADSSEPFSGSVTPNDVSSTPQLPGIPTPPLSTKPSTSSFHWSAPSRPAHLIPSSEIPPILIGDPNDEWANKLGHANYTIHPEPYVPEKFDLEACRQLRANWDLARCNYTKHLVRTGEHYGVTSKTYKLTEVKWSYIDSIWRSNNDITVSKTAENSADAFATLKHTTLGEAGSRNIMTKIPSLNDLRSEGKFPLLGDEDIVGPMVQVAAQLHRKPSKKAKLFRFFSEKFPVSLTGRS